MSSVSEASVFVWFLENLRITGPKRANVKFFELRKLSRVWLLEMSLLLVHLQLQVF